MAKKHIKIQKKKRKTTYPFVIGIILVGIFLLSASLVSNAFNEVDINTFSGGGTTDEVKSFQPSDPKKHIPGRLIWGRDF